MLVASSSTVSLPSASTVGDARVPRQSAQNVSLPKLLRPPAAFQSQFRPCRTSSLSRNVLTMATGEAPGEAASTDVSEYVKTVQDAWDKVEDKYAVSTLAAVGFVALIASSGVISAIDRLPLIPGVLELVGIGFTGWFVYKNIFFQPDREAFVGKVKETLKDIVGGK